MSNERRPERPTTKPDAVGAVRRRSPVLLGLRALALLFVAGLLSLLVYRLIVSGRGGRLVAAVRAHREPPAPDFKLKVIWPHIETWPALLRKRGGGGKLSPRELRGYPVVLNFWASWCIPCRHEAPLLSASARAHRGTVVFLGIDVQDFVSDARHFLRRYHVNYVSVHDSGGSTYDDYGITGVPETYYLDRRGRIVAHTPGEVSRRELEASIAQARIGTQ